MIGNRKLACTPEQFIWVFSGTLIIIMTSMHLLYRLRKSLSSDQQIILDACIAFSNLRDEPLYVVGGTVRDLINKVEHGRGTHTVLDVDLAVSGDAMAISRAVARKIGAELTIYGRFDTATIRLGDARVDLARTRTEHYPKSGVLPVVEPASIVEDLARRDFSVNAMAIGLTGLNVGILFDPFNGCFDLRRKRIDILHEKSFCDDPSRMLRACQYMARIDGCLTGRTRDAMHRNRETIKLLSVKRFNDAWNRLINDPTADVALLFARRFKLTQARVPTWTLSPRFLNYYFRRSEFDTFEMSNAKYFWAVLALSQPQSEMIRSVSGQCISLSEEQEILQDSLLLAEDYRHIRQRKIIISSLTSMLRRHHPVSIFAAHVVWNGIAGNRVEAFMDTWSRVQSPLSASELISVGVSRGPDLNLWLEVLRDVVLDDEFPVSCSAVDWVRYWVRSLEGQSLSRADLRGFILHRRRKFN